MQMIFGHALPAMSNRPEPLSTRFVNRFDHNACNDILSLAFEKGPCLRLCAAVETSRQLIEGYNRPDSVLFAHNRCNRITPDVGFGCFEAAP